MALKPARSYSYGKNDISFFMNEVSEAGTALVFCPDSSGVGAAMDDPNATVCLSTGAEGEFVYGMLAHDVVDIDETRCCRNFDKVQHTVCSKVTIITQGGWALTNQIPSDVEPKAGDAAYGDADGQWTNVDNGNSPGGRFLSAKDSDGYAKIVIGQ